MSNEWKDLVAGDGDALTIEVDGHPLKLTSLDKVYYPETGTTKRDVILYYGTIAPQLLAHAGNRPITRKRWVDGVGTKDHPEDFFFQKNVDDQTPEWVRRVPIEYTKKTSVHPVAGDVAALLWLAQTATLELHVPQWKVNKAGRPQNPDRLVFDLDPGEGVGLPECAEVACLVRGSLRDRGFDPLPVTSGSKGIHVYACLPGKETSDHMTEIAKEVALSLQADHSDLIARTMARSKRVGKVFIDWSQNRANKTTIAPYSLRGRLHPTVAAPRSWQEIAAPSLRQLDYQEVLARVEDRGDLLAALL